MGPMLHRTSHKQFSATFNIAPPGLPVMTHLFILSIMIVYKPTQTYYVPSTESTHNVNVFSTSSSHLSLRHIEYALYFHGNIFRFGNNFQNIIYISYMEYN